MLLKEGDFLHTFVPDQYFVISKDKSNQVTFSFNYFILDFNNPWQVAPKRLKLVRHF